MITPLLKFLSIFIAQLNVGFLGLDFVGSRPFWIDRARDRWITSYMFTGKNLGYIAKVNASRLLELLTGAHANSRSTLEVPIFWFIYGDPLLVDKHLQAKALSDMVIVIQSDQSFLESPLQCNGKSLLLDLRRLIKPTMATVSEHLAGLLPLPISDSQAHESAIEDTAQLKIYMHSNKYLPVWVHVNTSPFRVAFVGKCNMKLDDEMEEDEMEDDEMEAFTLLHRHSIPVLPH
ncbi:hypothetical protein ACFE04_009343 [Oxalis oulophora]